MQFGAAVDEVKLIGSVELFQQDFEGEMVVFAV